MCQVLHCRRIIHGALGFIMVAKHDDASPNHLTMWIAVHIGLAHQKVSRNYEGLIQRRHPSMGLTPSVNGRFSEAALQQRCAA
jgi:hypothetical protein